VRESRFTSLTSGSTSLAMDQKIVVKLLRTAEQARE